MSMPGLFLMWLIVLSLLGGMGLIWVCSLTRFSRGQRWIRWFRLSVVINFVGWYGTLCYAMAMEEARSVLQEEVEKELSLLIRFEADATYLHSATELMRAYGKLPRRAAEHSK